jgi:uncharacterized membrane protein/mono/diheme cytochrome c family protein
MPIPASWIQLHAALTHFPIVLLLVALFFDAGAIVFKRPMWREMGLILLTLAVLSLPTALFSGYLAGRDMRRPPSGFDLHWKAAILTSIIAALLWLWRYRTRHQNERAPQLLMLCTGLASAFAVAHTGHMGGEMVFGGRSATGQFVEELPTVVSRMAVDPTPDSAADSKGPEKIVVAAGKMEKAAGKLDQATDRLVKATSEKPRLPIASTAPVVSSPAIAPPSHSSQFPPASVTALDSAAQKLEKVAERFEQTASKMEAITESLQARESTARAAPPTRPTVRQTAPATSGTSKANAKASTPTQEASSQAFDSKLVAAGEKIYFNPETGCMDCHKMNGQGGRSGPDLTYAGRLHPDVEWQIEHLKNPKSKVPGSSMPAYDDLSRDDLRALATYLASLK